MVDCLIKLKAHSRDILLSVRRSLTGSVCFFLFSFISLMMTVTLHADTGNTVQEDRIASRLKAYGFSKMPQIYLRVFKQENDIEVWIGASRTKDAHKAKAASLQYYKVFKTYKICHWSGKLGPKYKEGDKQAPEGLYSVPADLIQWSSGKWPRAINLAYPNIFDLAHGRTGSHLLIHGGCQSLGCFAMGDGAMDEIYSLISLAKRGGQQRFPIHIFPFRLTDQKLKSNKQHAALPFWRQLQPAYQLFNEKRQLPQVFLCQNKYHSLPADADRRRLAKLMADCLPIIPSVRVTAGMAAHHPWLQTALKRQKIALETESRAKRKYVKVSCNLKRPSCRRWLALHKIKLKNGTLAKNLTSYR